MCDEEFDSFCYRFTTMSRVMEYGGWRIASPAWPWIFKVKFWNSRISWIVGPIDMPIDMHFKQWNWVLFPLCKQPHLRRAPYPPVVNFDFRLARERTWVQFTHCTSGLPRLLSKIVVAFCELRQLRSGWSFGQVGSVWSCLFTSCQPYLRGQNGGAITWPIVFSWISAHVSRVFAFPKEKRQPSSLSTMPLDWRAIALYSRQSLSLLQGLVAWGTRPLLRRRRWRLYASIPLQAFQQRRVVQSQMNQARSHEFLGRDESPWFLRMMKSLVSNVERPSTHGSDRRSVEECGP